jgi:hypothetical protein
VLKRKGYSYKASLGKLLDQTDLPTRFTLGEIMLLVNLALDYLRKTKPTREIN